MTDARTDMTVHQVFFGWSDEHRKLALLAHSFDRPEQRSAWLHKLQDHIRLQPVPDAELPGRAFSYFVFPGGQAAVLRRVNVGTSPGRNNSHALVGPADVLTAGAALGLGLWTGWQDVPPLSGRMTLMSADVLADAADKAQRLRNRLPEQANNLVAVLAGLLEDPGAPVSIIGGSEDGRLPLVWGLREVAERNQLGFQDWTFSTYEDRHDAERLPNIVFLPVRPYDIGMVTRTIVDLTQTRPAGAQLEYAQQLVHELLAVGTPSARVTVPRREPDAAIGGRQPDTRTQIAPRPVHDDPRRRPSQPLRAAPSERDLVSAVLDARNTREFDERLARLQLSTPQQRQALRSALDGAAMNEVARHIEITIRQELLGRLLEVAYGPGLEDLSDGEAHKHAVRLVRAGESDQLAMMVGRAKRADRTAISGAAFDRWAKGAGKASDEPTARLARRLRDARRSRRLPLIAAAGAAAIVGVAFLGGLLAGLPGPDTGNSAAGGTVSPSLKPPPAPQPAVRPWVGVASVAAVDLNRSTVFGFVRSPDGKSYYPQAPCTLQGVDLWLCARRPDTRAADSMVAIVVPRDEAGHLSSDAGVGAASKHGAAWGAEVPVF